MNYNTWFVQYIYIRHDMKTRINFVETCKKKKTANNSEINLTIDLAWIMRSVDGPLFLTIDSMIQCCTVMSKSFIQFAMYTFWERQFMTIDKCINAPKRWKTHWHETKDLTWNVNRWRTSISQRRFLMNGSMFSFWKSFANLSIIDTVHENTPDSIVKKKHSIIIIRCIMQYAYGVRSYMYVQCSCINNNINDKEETEKKYYASKIMCV